MKSCESIKSLFSDYLDDYISPVDKNDVDTHITTCTECQAALQQIQLITQRVRIVSPVKTSPQFDQNLRRRISEKSSPQKQILSSRTFSLGFSGIAAVAALSFFIISYPQNTDTIPEDVSGNPTNVQQQLNPDAGDKTPAIAVEEPKQDSLRNSPEKIDKNKIHLVGQD